jgi:hypothetical protein
MAGQKTITASLEGMRALADEKQCELQEYNFVTEEWLSKDRSSWPLSRSLADRWLSEWNHEHSDGTARGTGPRCARQGGSANFIPDDAF